MNKMSTLLAALLFASVSVAYAAAPATPATQGTTSVQDNLADNKSGGHADKGLITAAQHIADKHDKHGKGEKAEGRAEKAEHIAKVERPARPERPGR